MGSSVARAAFGTSAGKAYYLLSCFAFAMPLVDRGSEMVEARH
jgi:hypothetical protein